MELIKLPSKEELQKGFETVMDYLLSTDYIAIEAYVDKLREQNNNISCDELAKKILHRKSIKNGLIGAITGVGGLITLPVSIPSDLLVHGEFRLQWLLLLRMSMDIQKIQLI